MIMEARPNRTIGRSTSAAPLFETLVGAAIQAWGEFGEPSSRN